MKTNIFSKTRWLTFTLLVLFAAIIMSVILATPVSAEEIKHPVDGGYIYFDTGTGTVTRADRTLTHVEIPSHINEVKVTKIGSAAFTWQVDKFGTHRNGYLISVTLPDTITEIAPGAFKGCINLESINLPDSITSIGYSAFEECYRLKSIDIPKNLTHIGNYAFMCCSGINSSVTIPGTLQEITTGVFDCCFDIPSILISDGVTTLGDWSFYKCNGLESIVLPKSVTHFGTSEWESKSIFYECNDLTVYYCGSESEWRSITNSDKVTQKVVFDYSCEAPYGHSFDSWEYTIIPTCTEDGEKLGVCTYCGEVQTRTQPAGHTWGETVTVTEPTCTATGNGVHACANCDLSEPVTLSKTAHSYGEWITALEEGCGTYGSIYRICSVCDYNQYEEIPPTGNHLWSEWTIKTEPTCKSEGERTRSCEICSKTATETLPLTENHAWSDWVVSVAPTSSDDGKEVRLCTVCNLTESRAAHNYGEWSVTVEPTVLAKGEKSRKCVNCDATETEEIAKLETVNPFTDVKDGKWYTDGILWCYYSGYMAGTSETVFDYKGNVTRAMFVTILAQIDGSDISGYSEMSFSDVKPGKWYSNAIEWAASNGYAAGLGEGIFGYKQNVSREQIAMFFYTYSEKNGIDVSEKADLLAYADLGRVHSWALDAMEWAVAKGLIGGTSETTLSPGDSATRAEIALIVKNYVENVKTRL